MNHKSLTITSLILLITLIPSCSRLSGEREVRRILAEVAKLQDTEETILKEVMSRENIWIGNRLNSFPANRAELEPIAQQQIQTLFRIIELEERQIKHLRRIPSATQDEDFLRYAELQTQLFEKRLESNRLGIRRFEFILDTNITSKMALDEKLAEIKAVQDQIDIDINKLEESKAEHRKRISK